MYPFLFWKDSRWFKRSTNKEGQYTLRVSDERHAVYRKKVAYNTVTY